MSPKRPKTAKEIINNLIKFRKSNSPKKIKNNNCSPLHYHKNNDNGLDGKYYLEH